MSKLLALTLIGKIEILLFFFSGEQFQTQWNLHKMYHMFLKSEQGKRPWRKHCWAVSSTHSPRSMVLKEGHLEMIAGPTTEFPTYIRRSEAWSKNLLQVPPWKPLLPVMVGIKLGLLKELSKIQIIMSTLHHWISLLVWSERWVFSFWKGFTNDYHIHIYLKTTVLDFSHSLFPEC